MGALAEVSEVAARAAGLVLVVPGSRVRPALEPPPGRIVGVQEVLVPAARILEVTEREDRLRTLDAETAAAEAKARKLDGRLAEEFKQRLQAMVAEPVATLAQHVVFKALDDARSKLSYDLYYVKNMSFALDLRILLKSVSVVLMGKGAL